MHCEVEFPEMVFGDGCLCVMWCGMIVYFGGVMYDFMWLDMVWSYCGRIVM